MYKVKFYICRTEHTALYQWLDENVPGWKHPDLGPYVRLDVWRQSMESLDAFWAPTKGILHSRPEYILPSLDYVLLAKLTWPIEEITLL